MGQKYFGRKASAKVLVELTAKLVEIHLFKKTVDKVFEMPDLQHVINFYFKKQSLNRAV